MTIQSLNSSIILDEQGQPIPLIHELNHKFNILHFQDSFGSGRTCSCVLASIEANLNRLNEHAATILIVADDAFDKNNPPTTQVRRMVTTKAEMKRLELLDEEGYVKRTTLIVDNNGNVLSTLPVTTEDELTTHIEQTVLPKLTQLMSQTLT